MHSRWY